MEKFKVYYTIEKRGFKTMEGKTAIFAAEKVRDLICKQNNTDSVVVNKVESVPRKRASK